MMKHGKVFLVCLLSLVLSISVAFAQQDPPQIDSIVPDQGRRDTTTQVHIYGSNLQATSKVSLYGGGPNIKGTLDQYNNLYGVYVSVDYAYVVDNYSGLHVIDITDPANPSEVSSCDTPGEPRGVYVSGGYAYVADGHPGLQVIDISSPTSAYIRGSCDTPGFAWRVHVSGNYAYVADSDSGLQVVDVSNPDNPVIIASCDTPGGALDVRVSGDYAYVADRDISQNSNLLVIDVSNPANVTNDSIIGSCAIGIAERIHVSGNYAYVTSGLGRPEHN